jgi:Subunit ChlI of Mg-chelatase
METSPNDKVLKLSLDGEGPNRWHKAGGAVADASGAPGAIYSQTELDALETELTAAENMTQLAPPVRKIGKLSELRGDEGEPPVKVSGSSGVCTKDEDGNDAVIMTHIGNGLPGFSIIGRDGSSERETRDRIRAAVLNSGFAWPNRPICVEAPAGSQADLAIAVSILQADGQLSWSGGMKSHSYLGELNLDGAVREKPYNDRSPQTSQFKEVREAGARLTENAATLAALSKDEEVDVRWAVVNNRLVDNFTLLEMRGDERVSVSSQARAVLRHRGLIFAAAETLPK